MMLFIVSYLILCTLICYLDPTTVYASMHFPFLFVLSSHCMIRPVLNSLLVVWFFNIVAEEIAEWPLQIPTNQKVAKIVKSLSYEKLNKINKVVVSRCKVEIIYDSEITELRRQPWQLKGSIFNNQLRCHGLWQFSEQGSHEQREKSNRYCAW